MSSTARRKGDFFYTTAWGDLYHRGLDVYVFQSLQKTAFDENKKPSIVTFQQTQSCSIRSNLCAQPLPTDK